MSFSSNVYLTRYNFRPDNELGSVQLQLYINYSSYVGIGTVVCLRCVCSALYVNCKIAL